MPSPAHYLLSSSFAICHPFNYDRNDAFQQNGSVMGKSPDPFLPRFLGKGSGYARLLSNQDTLVPMIQGWLDWRGFIVDLLSQHVFMLSHQQLNRGP